jgi:hypothetical protein
MAAGIMLGLAATPTAWTATAYYGNVADLGQYSHHSANYLLGCQIEVPEVVNLVAAGILFRAGGVNGNVGIYSSGAPEQMPGELLATTGSFSVSSSGTKEIPFTEEITLQPGWYWFMAVYQTTANIGYTVNSDDLVVYRSLPFNGTLPTTFGTPLTYTGQEFNYYLKTETVPEPTTMGLLSLAITALGCCRWRRI